MAKHIHIHLADSSSRDQRKFTEYQAWNAAAEKRAGPDRVKVGISGPGNEISFLSKHAVVAHWKWNRAGTAGQGFVDAKPSVERIFEDLKRRGLLGDRREYDVDDFKSAYPELSRQAAQELFNKVQAATRGR